MTAKLQLAAYSSLMGLIILSAYLGWIPTELHDIPFYDSAGHFLLYGLWGYFFGNAFPQALLSVAGFRVQLGIAAVTLVAVAEESLQQLSPMRSFSLGDLAFGLCGIALSCAILQCRN